MIPVILPATADFKNRISYIARGVPTAKDVRYLNIQFPRHASVEMEAIRELANATRRRPIRMAALHMVLSLRPGETVTRDEFFAIGTEFLRAIGLAGHQAVLAIHLRNVAPEPDDTLPDAGGNGGDHLHIVASRVHPQRLEANWMPHSYAKAEIAVRGIEQKWGLQTDNGHFVATVAAAKVAVARKPDVDVREQQLRRVPRWIRQESLASAEADFIRAASLASAYIGSTQTASWKQFHSNLATLGLKYEIAQAKNRGAVVRSSRARDICPASRLGRHLSLQSLERRFGPFEERGSDIRSDEIDCREIAAYPDVGRHVEKLRLKGSKQQVEIPPSVRRARRDFASDKTEIRRQYDADMESYRRYRAIILAEQRQAARAKRHRDYDLRQLRRDAIALLAQLSQGNIFLALLAIVLCVWLFESAAQELKQSHLEDKKKFSEARKRYSHPGNFTAWLDKKIELTDSLSREGQQLRAIRRGRKWYHQREKARRAQVRRVAEARHARRQEQATGSRSNWSR